MKIRADIVYLSPPVATDMDEDWYNEISLKQFWMARRFDVFCKLCGKQLEEKIGGAILEIGCGTGILQTQLENYFDINVTGFDLNENALINNISKSPVICYDIYSRNSSFKEKFDVVFLFDVLEHIDNDFSFLKAIRFHIKPGGYLFLNVPAEQNFIPNTILQWGTKDVTIPMIFFAL